MRQEVHGMVQLVEDVHQEVHGIVQEMERTKLWMELEDLKDDQSAYYKTSGEDSESAGSWRCYICITMSAPAFQAQLQTHRLQLHHTPSASSTDSAPQFHPQYVTSLTNPPSLPEPDPTALSFSSYCTHIFTSFPMV